MRLSSGVTAIATTDNTAVTAIAAGLAGEVLHNLCVTCANAAPGFVSIDGGDTWHFFKPEFPTASGYRAIWSGIQFRVGDAVTVKRIADGSNISVYVSLW